MTGKGQRGLRAEATPRARFTFGSDQLGEKAQVNRRAKRIEDNGRSGRRKHDLGKTQRRREAMKLRLGEIFENRDISDDGRLFTSARRRV